MSYSNLATVLQDLGDLKPALDLAQRALAIFKTVLPTGHCNIRIAQNIVEGIEKEIKEKKNP